VKLLVLLVIFHSFAVLFKMSSQKPDFVLKIRVIAMVTVIIVMW